MKKDLESVANYILNINNVPLAALKRTSRPKVYLFGKNGVVDVDMSSKGLSLLVMSTEGLQRELMHIYHDFEDHTKEEFTVTVNKTLELSELPFFENQNVHKFNITVDKDGFKIIDENKNECLLEK